MFLEEPSPRAGATSTAAALAGTARPSHRPPPDRRSPSRRSRRSARRAPTRGSATSGPRCAPTIRITHGPSPAPTKACSVQGGQWKKSQGSEASLLALDEQPAFAGENEERLLIRLGVIDAALARLEDGHVDPELLELDRRIAVLVREPARCAPLSEDHHWASRTLTTNQPSVSGARPEPESVSRASVTAAILAAQAQPPCVRECLLSVARPAARRLDLRSVAR